MLEQYVKRILRAKVYNVALESPLEEAPLLSARLDNRVLLKREDQQPSFSFKLRGSYNKIARLKDQQRRRGVIAASAGNHAQGVALAAREMDLRAHIVMPRTTPDIKVAAVRALGARVILHGDSYDQAAQHATRKAQDDQLALIPPYDDPEVIAGQGTVGMEIARQAPQTLDAVFVPVGGGGLLAGVTAYLKYVRPRVRIVPVEPADAACLEAALHAGRRVTLPQVGLFVDGAAVAQIGREPFRLVRGRVEPVVTVSVDEICAAIKDIFEDTRTIAEPAGALAVAGLKRFVAQHRCQGQTLAAINSGANINFDRLRHISERTEIGERREAILCVTIPEKPGSFQRFCTILKGRNLTEFNYRYRSGAQAHVFVGLAMSPGEDARPALVQLLEGQGYAVVDLTDNEMAKLHIRHMVGGRTADVPDEELYRFEFPEYPGALPNFLQRLGGRWNISLFHYRNHGAAYGRVLLGLQVPPQGLSEVEQLLKKLRYRYWRESDNPAYRFFLRLGDSAP